MQPRNAFDNAAVSVQHDATLTGDGTVTTPLSLASIYTKIASQIFTANGNYTPTPGTKAARVRLVGSGGSGGSASTANGSGGTGGGSGEYVEAWVTNGGAAITGGAVTIGAAQAAAGAAGNPTSIVIGGVTITGQGGGAGVSVTTATGGHSSTAPILGASGSTAFDVHRHAERGQPNVMVAATPAYVGGNGASGLLGRGGNGANGGNTAGGAGTGYGAGGGGASRSTANATGGASAPGVVIVEEFL